MGGRGCECWVREGEGGKRYVPFSLLFCLILLGFAAACLRDSSVSTNWQVKVGFPRALVPSVPQTRKHLLLVTTDKQYGKWSNTTSVVSSRA